MTAKEAVKILSLFAAAIPGASLTAEQIRDAAAVWCKLFAHHSYEQVEAAAIKCLESHVYNTIPTPGSVYQAMKLMLSAGEPDAATAYLEVREALERGGGRYCEDSILAAMTTRTAYAVRRLGWQAICESPSDKSAVLFAQFERIYNESRQHTPDASRLPEGRERLRLQAARALAAIEQKEETDGTTSRDDGYDERDGLRRGDA